MPSSTFLISYNLLQENAGSGSSEKDEALRSAKLRLCWGHSFTLELACFLFDIRNTHLVHAHISRNSAPGPYLKEDGITNVVCFGGNMIVRTFRLIILARTFV